MPSRIAEVSLNDIHRVGAEYIHDRQLTVLVVGDRATIQPGLVELGLPIVELDNEGMVLPPTDG